MKSTIILTLLALVFSSFNTVDKTMKIVNKVNKLRTTWQAAPYYRDIRPLLGARRDDSHRLPLRDIKVSDDLPESFDLREQYPYCESIKEIRDQSKCGSCWAFSSAEVMSDRICIVTEGRFQTRVSPQHIITCCTSCGYGCFGGWPSSAFSFWKRSGIPSGGLYLMVSSYSCISRFPQAVVLLDKSFSDPVSFLCLLYIIIAHWK